MRNHILNAILLALLISASCHAQIKNSGQIIQLTGIVTNEDSTAIISGAHVYSNLTGQGTTTNAYGYFTKPFLVGDTITISAVGYQSLTHVVPELLENSITTWFQLSEDTIYLQPVDILPFLSEQAFKQAIIDLELEDDAKVQMEMLNGPSFMEMVELTPYNGYLQSQYYLDQQRNYRLNPYGNLSNPFLNPIKWYKFFKDLKSGKYKRKTRN